MFEIASSKLAVSKAGAEVKSFADRMLMDHSNTAKQLNAIAEEAKIKLSTALDAEHKTK